MGLHLESEEDWCDLATNLPRRKVVTTMRL